MSNYFTGKLYFRISSNQKEMVQHILDFVFAQDTDPRSDANPICPYPENIIWKGLQLWPVESYGWRLREPEIMLHTSFEDGEGLDWYMDNVAAGCYLEHASPTDTPVPFKQALPDIEINADSLIDIIQQHCLPLTFAKLNPEYTFDIELYVCGTQFAHGQLMSLIDYWSPYLEPGQFIGTVRDEDGTFTFDYYAGRVAKIQHYEFCGYWCDQFHENRSCTDPRCLHVYKSGARLGKSAEFDIIEITKEII